MISSLGRGLSTSPMFLSPCHVPDTLFHLLSPENLAPKARESPESLSNPVAGCGFYGCLTLYAPGAWRQAHRCWSPPQAHDAPHPRALYKSFSELKAALPLAQTEPVEDRCHLSPLTLPFSSQLQPGQAAGVGGRACLLPTRPRTWPPQNSGFLSCRWGH